MRLPAIYKNVNEGCLYLKHENHTGCLYPVEGEAPVLLLVVYEAFELILILGKVDAHRLREGGREGRK